VQRGLSPCTLAQKASFPFRSIYDFSPFILSVIVTLSLHQAVVVEQQATCAHVQVRVRICVCVASISHIYLINQLVLVNLPTQQGIKPRPKSEPAPVYLPYSTYYPCSVCVCICASRCASRCALNPFLEASSISPYSSQNRTCKSTVSLLSSWSFSPSNGAS